MNAPTRKDQLHSTIDYKKLIELQGNEYYQSIDLNQSFQKRTNEKKKVKRRISKLPRIPRK